jgi:hypothetical protein
MLKEAEIVERSEMIASYRSLENALSGAAPWLENLRLLCASSDLEKKAFAGTAADPLQEIAPPLDRAALVVVFAEAIFAQSDADLFSVLCDITDSLNKILDRNARELLALGVILGHEAIGIPEDHTIEQMRANHPAVKAAKRSKEAVK